MKHLRHILSVGMLIALVSSASAQSWLTNGLAAHWKLEGDANDTLGVSDGVASGVLWTNAQSASGVNRIMAYFNGSSVINVNPTSNLYSSPNGFSLFAWIKPTTTGSRNDNNIIYAVSGNYQLGFGTTLLNSELNPLQGAYQGAYNYWNNKWHVDDLPNPLNNSVDLFQANQWYLLGVTYNGTNVYGYINGVQLLNSASGGGAAKTFPIGAATGVFTTPLKIGYPIPNNEYPYNNEFPGGFQGYMRNLRLYNRALSSNEVAQLYALEAPVPPVVTDSPQSVTTVAGSSTNLSVTGTGSELLTYQWLKDGVALPGATNASLLFSNLQPVNVGDYAAVVSNGGGSVTSSVASVSIPGVNSGVWQGLVAYYPFNGNANDESGYGNNGTVYGATLATDRFGSLSSCYSFIGNNNGPNNGYISVPSSSALQLTTNLTLSLWMKKTTNLLWGIVLCKGDNPEKSYSLTYDTRGTGGIDFNQQGSYNMINAYQPLPNDWIQVVCTLFGTNACVYYNGAFLTNGIGVSLGKGNGALTFGTILSAAPMSYSGLLDDIRIYKRALSSNEVAQLYLSEAPPTPPRTGTATATLSFGFFVNATVTDSGFGYTNTPLVRIVGGGGSGAQAVAVVSNGLVVGINVINPGSGYTSAPMVVIQPPVIAQPELGISAHTLLSFTNLAVSGNYQLQRSKEWYWTNEAASFTATGLFYTQMVAGAPGSKTYRLALSPAPAQAFATPVVAYGFLVAANVTAGGSGYVSKPNVHIAGGGGSNAVAVANMSGGSVSSISMLNAGYGYTNTPTLQIDPPPAASINPSAIPVMRVDSGALSPYDNYQVEFKPELGGAWQNWGGNFVPTAATNSQWLYITNGMGFFRVKYLP